MMNNDEHSASPSPDSEEHTGHTLSYQGSEDVSYLLDAPKVTGGTARGEPGPDGYLPHDRLDWTVWLDFEDDPVLARAKILEVFDLAWRKGNGWPTVYGFSPKIHTWTFVDARGVPEEYTHLAVAWRLYQAVCGGDGVEAGTLVDYSTSVVRAAGKLGRPLPRHSVSPEDAARVSTDLARLVKQCDQDARIVLTNPVGTHYAGYIVWDVMMSLGLRWGTMDIFHWPNHGHIGGDMLFSVWTTTPPGYFLPEEIEADRLNVQDLVFGFSIPRSCDPLHVFTSMLRAAQYSRDRLGGTLLDEQGQPMDETAERNRITEVIEKLAQAGFTPGQHDTRYVF